MDEATKQKIKEAITFTRDVEDLKGITAEDLFEYRSDNGETVLILVAKQTNISSAREKTDLLKHLLKTLGDLATSDFLNLKDNDGNNALLGLFKHYNVEPDDIDLLTDKGIDLNSKNRNGKSAVMLARAKNKSDIASHLIRKGAEDEDNDYLRDEEDRRNISYYGESWTYLVNGITTSVKNSKLSSPELPLARLNSDSSVSFILEKKPMPAKSWEMSDSQRFLIGITEYFVQEQLRHHATGFGYQTIGSRDIVEVIDDRENSIEYKINLSPQQLDSIFKLNPLYSGYRNEGGLLQLKGISVVKDGAIMMFPVFPLEGDEEKSLYLPRVAGCQLTEIPSLQLMYLMNDESVAKQHKEKGLSYHHMPAEVAEALDINRATLLEICEGIFKDNDASFFSRRGDSKESVDHENTDNSYLEIKKTRDKAKQDRVRIVEMDQRSKDFYTAYGNTTSEELSHCQSVEIDTLAFLEGVKTFLTEKQNSAALKTVNSMIEAEGKRRGREEVEKKYEENHSSEIDLEEIHPEEIHSEKKEEPALIPSGNSFLVRTVQRFLCCFRNNSQQSNDSTQNR